ncbi:putative GNAT family acetyltransferase [Astrocystis sublimbata]|nr:putative GNAT family acetyltransferase [Astrocystis sublimbata]
MPVVILPALIPDIRRIYEVYFAAFDADYMGQLILKILFPQAIDEAFKTAHAAGTLQWWHGCDYQYTMKAVDTDTCQIIGMGLGDILYKPRTVEERANHGAPWLEGEQRARAEKILNPLWEVREKFFGGQPHIYCHVIAVDPAYQGRKAGAAFCEWAIDLGERTQLPVYFESSPSTVNLYKKMGFELLPESIVHKAEVLGTDTDIEVPLMVRMPSSAGSMTFEEWRSLDYPKFNARGNSKVYQTGASANAAHVEQTQTKQLGVTATVVAISEAV